MGGTCGTSALSLNQASEVLDGQVLELEMRIVAMTQDATNWASKVGTDPAAKMRAIQCLRKKKQYETQRETLLGIQANIDGVQFQQEQTEVALKTAQALRKGHEKMKELQQKMSPEELELLMDDMQDHSVALRESQDVLARSGALDGMCDHEFEMEFEKIASCVVTQDDVHSTDVEKAAKYACAKEPFPQQPLQVSTAPRKRLPTQQVPIGISPISPNLSQSTKHTQNSRQEQIAAFKLRFEEPHQKCIHPEKTISCEKENKQPLEPKRVSLTGLAPPSSGKERRSETAEQRKERHRLAKLEIQKMEERAQSWAAAALPVCAPRSGMPMRQPMMVA